MGVDHDLRLVIGEIIVELVGEFDVDQRRDRPQPPGAQHGQDVIQAVMGEDRDPVALGARRDRAARPPSLHRGNRLGVAQRAVAIDPAEGQRVRPALGVMEQELVHQHRQSGIKVASDAAIQRRKPCRAYPRRLYTGHHAPVMADSRRRAGPDSGKLARRRPDDAPQPALEGRMMCAVMPEHVERHAAEFGRRRDHRKGRDQGEMVGEGPAGGEDEVIARQHRRHQRIFGHRDGDTARQAELRQPPVDRAEQPARRRGRRNVV